MLKYIVKITLLLFMFWVVCGFDIPNYEWYVTDKVGVFSEAQKTDITTKIEEIEKTTSIEIAILVVSTVDDDINLLATDVGNKRWVGKEGQNNGLLVLIAVDDRKWSIQVGYGLEWTLPDLATKRIGEARFPPNFREWNYYQGVIEMLDDALLYIKQDPTIVQNYSQDTTSSFSNSSFSNDMIGVLFFVFVAITGFFSRWVTVAKTTGKGRTMKKYGRWMVIGAGLVLSFVVTWVIWSFIISLFFSYIFLLFNVLMALFWRTWVWWWWVYWWGSWWWWGSSFGGFGGWSFGGGWSSWSR